MASNSPHKFRGNKLLSYFLVLLVIFTSSWKATNAATVEQSLIAYLRLLGDQRYLKDGEHNQLPNVFRYSLSHFRFHELGNFDRTPFLWEPVLDDATRGVPVAAEAGLELLTTVDCTRPNSGRVSGTTTVIGPSSALWMKPHDALVKGAEWAKLDTLSTNTILATALKAVANVGCEDPQRTGRVTTVKFTIKLKPQILLDVFRAPELTDWSVANFVKITPELTVEDRGPEMLNWTTFRYVSPKTADQWAGNAPDCRLGRLFRDPILANSRARVSITPSYVQIDPAKKALGLFPHDTVATFELVEFASSTGREPRTNSVTFFCNYLGKWQIKDVSTTSTPVPAPIRGPSRLSNIAPIMSHRLTQLLGRS